MTRSIARRSSARRVGCRLARRSLSSRPPVAAATPSPAELPYRTVGRFGRSEGRAIFRSSPGRHQLRYPPVGVEYYPGLGTTGRCPGRTSPSRPAVTGDHRAWAPGEHSVQRSGHGAECGLRPGASRGAAPSSGLAVPREALNRDGRSLSATTLERSLTGSARSLSRRRIRCASASPSGSLSAGDGACRHGASSCAPPCSGTKPDLIKPAHRRERARLFVWGAPASAACAGARHPAGRGSSRESWPWLFAPTDATHLVIAEIPSTWKSRLQRGRRGAVWPASAWVFRPISRSVLRDYLELPITALHGFRTTSARTIFPRNRGSGRTGRSTGSTAAATLSRKPGPPH